MAVVGAEAMIETTEKRNFVPNRIYRHSKFLHKKSTMVKLVDAPDGVVFVMWSCPPQQLLELQHLWCRLEQFCRHYLIAAPRSQWAESIIQTAACLVGAMCPGAAKQGAKECCGEKLIWQQPD
jgi:hypothetical protein